MSSSNNWQDRRGLAQPGKVLHEGPKPGGRKFSETGSISNAVRRASASSGSGSPTSDKPKDTGGIFPTASPSGRRRSSAGQGGLFGTLQQHKRGSDDYGDKRAAHHDASGGGGMVGNWFNQTFKGHQKPADDQNK